MDIHHIGPEHISIYISGVYLRKNISGHGYTSHWSGACLWKYVQSVSPENDLRTWIYITLVRSISPKISTEHISENISRVISGKTSPDLDIHHIGLEHISKNFSRVYLRNNIPRHGYTSHWSRAYLHIYLRSVSPEKHLRTWIYITLVRSMSLEICPECISRKSSPDMDIHHIGPEHISKNIYRAYLRNISRVISGKHLRTWI